MSIFVNKVFSHFTLIVHEICVAKFAFKDTLSETVMLDNLPTKFPGVALAGQNFSECELSARKIQDL